MNKLSMNQLNAINQYKSHVIDSEYQLLCYSEKYNKVFAKYKNAFRGKNVFIIGSGPTEKKFSPWDKNGIYIGLNYAYKDSRIKFDYLFTGDSSRQYWNQNFLEYTQNKKIDFEYSIKEKVLFDDDLKDFFLYRKEKCIKFVDIFPHDPINFIGEIKNGPEYVKNIVIHYSILGEIYQDISILPVSNLQGTVFQTIQFALYGDPDKIYLVGFDVSKGDSFTNSDEDFSYQMDSWKYIHSYLEAKKLIDRFFSINPVGLKGMFNDIYTEQ